MSQFTLTSQGQITIPKDVRGLLQLHAGYRVEFIEHDRHEIILKPIT